MNTIQEDILNKFKKALSNEDLEKLKNKDSNIILKIGIFLIAIATILTILRTISISIIETNLYIFTFWPSLIIGSMLIIITIWFRNSPNTLEIQKNLIEKGFDVYNLNEDNKFEYIQEFGNLLFKDLDNFLHSDKELILTLRDVFYKDNELSILSENNSSLYFKKVIRANNQSFYIYNQLYGYVTTEQKILLKRLKELLEKLEQEELPNKKLLINNEIDLLQKRISLPIEVIFENVW
jgi:hypothetical protein